MAVPMGDAAGSPPVCPPRAVRELSRINTSELIGLRSSSLCFQRYHTGSVSLAGVGRDTQQTLASVTGQGCPARRAWCQTVVSSAASQHSPLPLVPGAPPPPPPPPPPARNAQGFHPLLADSSYQASNPSGSPSLTLFPIGSWLPLLAASPLPLDALSFCFGV